LRKQGESVIERREKKDKKGDGIPSRKHCGMFRTRWSEVIGGVGGTDARS